MNEVNFIVYTFFYITSGKVPILQTNKAFSATGGLFQYVIFNFHFTYPSVLIKTYLNIQY
jgi:hypothetical protein